MHQWMCKSENQSTSNETNIFFTHTIKHRISSLRYSFLLLIISIILLQVPRVSTDLLTMIGTGSARMKTAMRAHSPPSTCSYRGWVWPQFIEIQRWCRRLVHIIILQFQSSAHPPGQPSCAGSCPRCPPWWAPSAPTRSCPPIRAEYRHALTNHSPVLPVGEAPAAVGVPLGEVYQAAV